MAAPLKTALRIALLVEAVNAAVVVEATVAPAAAIARVTDQVDNLSDYLHNFKRRPPHNNEVVASHNLTTVRIPNS